MTSPSKAPASVSTRRACGSMPRIVLCTNRTPGLTDVAVGVLHRLARRAPEHHVELGEAEDEAVGPVDEHDLDVVAELLGQPRRQLQPTEPRAQHQYSHGCESTASWRSVPSTLSPVPRLLPFVLASSCSWPSRRPRPPVIRCPSAPTSTTSSAGARPVPAHVGIVVRDRKARADARAATTSVTSTASRPRPTSAGSGSGTRAGAAEERSTASSTARGASGCSTCARREALSGSRRSCGIWTQRLRQPGATTPSSSTTSTRSPAAAGCSSGRRPSPTPGCSCAWPTPPACRRARRTSPTSTGAGRLRLRGRRGVRPLPRVRVLRRALRPAGAVDRVPARRLHAGPARTSARRLPVVLRDLDLTPRGVRDWC